MDEELDGANTLEKLKKKNKKNKKNKTQSKKKRTLWALEKQK